LDAYVAASQALGDWERYWGGVLRRWPNTCVEQSAKQVIGGDECDLTELEIQNIRDISQQSAAAIMRLQLVGTRDVTRAALDAGSSLTYRYNASRPHSMAAPKILALRELRKRNLSSGDLKAGSEIESFRRTAACELNDFYVIFGPDDSPPVISSC
jgi:hypothetical protein